MSPTDYLRYKYTPDEINEKDFLDRFVVRTDEFKDLYKKIKTADYQKPQQHFIIIGQRGQGKTTLLRRIRIAVEKDKKLSKFLIAVKFTEEQYQIRSLCRLWEEVADYLQCLYPDDFEDILDEMEKHFEDKDYDIRCFTYLEKYVKSRNKKLLLLIDNIDELLGKLKEKEQHQLREILISSSTFRIIGGSTKMIEQHYDYGKPFYEFFQAIRLQGLNKDDCIRFLKVIGNDAQRKKIQQIISESPQRIETLRRLTGGVPRTMVMLFDIFIDDEGNSFEDLLKVLDEATPLYKHRMDDLPTTLQDITHVIAMNWDGLGTKEIAARTRLQSKEVSAQLKQLENKYGIIESTSIGKNKIYKLEERLFNIWYLMRFGRNKDRQKVEWLVRFLNSWCSPDELEQRSRQFLQAVSGGKIKTNYAYHMCEALGYAGLSPKTEYMMKEKVREYLQKNKSDLAKYVSSSDKELIGKAQASHEQGSIKEAITILEKVNEPNSLTYDLLGLFHHDLKDYVEAEKYYLKSVNTGSTSALNNLGGLYAEQKDFTKAEQYFLKAVDAGDSLSLFNLGVMHQEQNDYATAEQYFMQAIEAGCNHADNSLSWFYFEQGKELEKALQSAEKSYSKDSNYNTHTYATVLLWAEDFKTSYQVFTEWLEIDSTLDAEDELTSYFLLLLAKGQYYQAKSFLEMKEYQLKDRLKPVWYALMSLMQDEFPNEIKKMGGELQETVDELLATIKDMEQKYAID